MQEDDPGKKGRLKELIPLYLIENTSYLSQKCLAEHLDFNSPPTPDELHENFMPKESVKITALPTRYEPLVKCFGDKAQATFIPSTRDIEAAKRLMASAESSHQGKFLFINAESGSGKSTFVHSLEIFAPDRVSSVIRLPQPYELEISKIPSYIASIPQTDRFTIINFDGRESPYFNESEYQTFLGALNSILRNRPDLLILWPVNDEKFAEKIVDLLSRVGGKSAFGTEPIHDLVGLEKEKYYQVLEKLLQVANWQIEDAAISHSEVAEIISTSPRVGMFLDSLHQLITNRFDVSNMGINFPNLVIAISSGDNKIRETCRSLRRADSFYIEASRLMMYTKRSNVVEWWAGRASNLKSALPHVIALFNAQLVSLSASSVVHSVLQHGDQELKNLISGVRPDKGNARRVIQSSELYKFIADQPLDSREYGSNVKEDTFVSYDKIQQVSDTKHKSINESIMKMMTDSGIDIPELAFENCLIQGLQSDTTYLSKHGVIAVEFHHKTAPESTPNKIAIYILEKIQEYAINFGLTER